MNIFQNNAIRIFMKLRKFEIDNDFESMENWVTDERTHAMWCANLIKYTLSEEHMAETMTAAADRFGDVPYVGSDGSSGRVNTFAGLVALSDYKHRDDRFCSTRGSFSVYGAFQTISYP